MKQRNLVKNIEKLAREHGFEHKVDGNQHQLSEGKLCEGKGWRADFKIYEYDSFDCLLHLTEDGYVTSWRCTNWKRFISCLVEHRSGIVNYN